MKIRTFIFAVCTLVPATALAETEVLNTEWVIPAHGTQAESFTLQEATPVHVSLLPVKDADKGVTVRIVPAEDFDACNAGGQGRCRSRGDFDGFAVRSFDHAGMVPPGRWTFYVKNTENLFKRAIVHVRVVANPGN